MKIEVHGSIEDGKLLITNRPLFISILKSIPDCNVIITIKKSGKRSPQSNRYYWGVVINEIYTELKIRGNRMEREQVHEMLKQRFNVGYVRNAGGDVIGNYPKETSELNSAEFTEYVEKCIEWATTVLEITIPFSNKQNDFL